MDKTHWRYPTESARKSLAKRFRLQYADSMQDWEWEVADAGRFDELATAFRSTELTEDERFSLMEVLVQCVEDMAGQAGYEAAWRTVEALLKTRPHSHRSTIEYWSCLDSKEAGTCFELSRTYLKTA